MQMVLMTFYLIIIARDL